MIGVDFGGTRIKVGVVEAGVIVKRVSVDTPSASGPDQIFDLIASTVGSLQPQPDSVGLAVPGGVNPEGICWRLPNVPGFEGVNIAGPLRDRLGCRVVVENDATAAALGELRYGHGRTHSSFLMLTLGTGIGGGLVLNGRLQRGRNGFAGEVGHTPLLRSEDGWPCGCGLKGCLESYAGTKGLLRKYTELSGRTVTEIQPIADAARQGEPAARGTMASLGRALGTAIAGFQNLLDLDAIVFTGGISGAFDLFAPELRLALRAHAFAPPLAEVPLLVSELADRAGLLGAACLPELA